MDALSGALIIDGDIPQQQKGELGNPADDSFAGMQLTEAGMTDLGQERTTWVPLPPGPILASSNANNWVVTSSDPLVATGIGPSLTPPTATSGDRRR